MSSAEGRSIPDRPARAADVGEDPDPTVVVWALVSLALLVVVTLNPAADPDLFARVAVGRLIEVTGEVMKDDPFAFTPDLHLPPRRPAPPGARPVA